jgi:hypothetical protein
MVQGFLMLPWQGIAMLMDGDSFISLSSVYGTSELILSFML